MRTRHTAIPSTTMGNKMKTVFVLFGVWKDNDFHRLVGVFETKEGMEAEMEWINTHDAPYFKMWHQEVGLKD